MEEGDTLMSITEFCESARGFAYFTNKRNHPRPKFNPNFVIKINRPLDSNKIKEWIAEGEQTSGGVFITTYRTNFHLMFFEYWQDIMIMKLAIE